MLKNNDSTHSKLGYFSLHLFASVSVVICVGITGGSVDGWMVGWMEAPLGKQRSLHPSALHVWQKAQHKWSCDNEMPLSVWIHANNPQIINLILSQTSLRPFYARRENNGQDFFSLNQFKSVLLLRIFHASDRWVKCHSAVKQKNLSFTAQLKIFATILFTVDWRHCYWCLWI